MKHWLYTTAIATALTAVAIPATAATSSGAECNGEFTKVDADGNGVISSSEANNAASIEFDRIDADTSGVVSKVEWQNCGLAAHLRETRDLSPTENPDGIAPQGMQIAIDIQPWFDDQDFTDADTDKSGDVTREEAAAAAEREYSSSGSQMEKEDFARVYGERFAQIDANGDGSLSKEEWNNRQNTRVDATFSHLDGNDDGQLSKSEWQEARNVDQSSSDPVTIWYYYIY